MSRRGFTQIGRSSASAGLPNPRDRMPLVGFLRQGPTPIKLNEKVPSVLAFERGRRALLAQLPLTE